MKGILTVLVEVSTELPNHMNVMKYFTSSEKELFEAKQIFMFSVLDKHLLTDMGKTTVRKYVNTTDAQSVWKEF